MVWRLAVGLPIFVECLGSRGPQAPLLRFAILLHSCGIAAVSKLLAVH